MIIYDAIGPIINSVSPAECAHYFANARYGEVLAPGSARYHPTMKRSDVLSRPRMMANELLGMDEHDRILLAPKLRAKFRARVGRGGILCQGDIFIDRLAGDL
jgi:hypothetical protein